MLMVSGVFSTRFQHRLLPFCLLAQLVAQWCSIYRYPVDYRPMSGWGTEKRRREFLTETPPRSRPGRSVRGPRPARGKCAECDHPRTPRRVRRGRPRHPWLAGGADRHLGRRPGCAPPSAFIARQGFGSRPRAYAATARRHPVGAENPVMCHAICRVEQGRDDEQRPIGPVHQQRSAWWGREVVHCPR